ncbi:MAG TPA: sugar ABC transporter permease [Candidatus Avimonoglobus intestinipullorum]|uniref:Sugar ABC transporter permease n=1 Tax=Candidatus Avimonoglobus intestinipullorum TaxID=2840699 RepID=A0A9D1LW18_9FIRM|nr:sugar ABC transporter permease [Candidatus Avimonoglobus intestinipullorum]
MVVPVLVFYIVFCYVPMYGALIAFQDYSPAAGMMGSEWVGLKHFITFFNDPNFGRLIRNTLSISILSLIFGFPAPMIFALLINEIRQNKFKRVVQTISYIPHFISLVVICGLIKDFVARDGFITILISNLTGMEPTNLLNNPSYYYPIYILSSIWQGMGWDAIIYIAALSAVDVSLYEAATIDGAGKWKQILHVTIPTILPTIIIMFIMRVGNLLNVGYEKTLLLYNPLTYERADIISSSVYRMAFETQQWSYSTAVGLFNSAVNFILVIIVNKICDRVSGTALW